jgi:hypothetical protein
VNKLTNLSKLKSTYAYHAKIIVPCKMHQKQFFPFIRKLTPLIKKKWQSQFLRQKAILCIRLDRCTSVSSDLFACILDPNIVSVWLYGWLAAAASADISALNTSTTLNLIYVIRHTYNMRVCIQNWTAQAVCSHRTCI